MAVEEEEEEYVETKLSSYAGGGEREREYFQ